MATGKTQGIIPLFPDLEDTDSFVISAFDMHIVFIIFLIIAGILGLRSVIMHYSKLFVRWMRLAMVFAFISSIGIFELFEHTNMPPAGHFWHYMHLASGIAAIYFVYLFTSTWESKTPERAEHVVRETVLVLLAMFVPLYALYHIELIIEVNFDALLFLVLSLLTLVILLKTWKNISNMNEVTRNTFSLKTFILTSALYSLIGILFLLTINIDIMGTALVLFGHNEITTLARIFQNMLYVVLTTTIMFFVFATMRAEAFYTPIARFLSTNRSTRVVRQKKASSAHSGKVTERSFSGWMNLKNL